MTSNSNTGHSDSVTAPKSAEKKQWHIPADISINGIMVGHAVFALK
jgi:hypothetical protein